MNEKVQVDSNIDVFIKHYSEKMENLSQKVQKIESLTIKLFAGAIAINIITAAVIIGSGLIGKNIIDESSEEELIEEKQFYKCPNCRSEKVEIYQVRDDWAADCDNCNFKMSFTETKEDMIKILGNLD